MSYWYQVWINTSDVILVGLRDYQLKSMKRTHLVPERMMKSSLMMSGMMMKTLMISKLNPMCYIPSILRVVLHSGSWSSAVKSKTSFSLPRKADWFVCILKSICLKTQKTLLRSF
ncbi:uncharacterized protein isoform X2 [Castor canadensis]|uniref:Uncharacterized protein isoform X2 n=4 Tax=Castor canadensis TaxID=51338 RepID=A0AC58LQE2_CASCN